MEDHQVDIMVGTGLVQHRWRWISRFTLVGATTRLSSLSHPLRDRFGHVWKMDLYEDADLAKIVERSAKILGVELGLDEAHEVAKRSRGTPRIANRLTKIVRDYRYPREAHRTQASLHRNTHRWIWSRWYRSTTPEAPRRQWHESSQYQYALNMLGRRSQYDRDVIEPYLIKIGLIENTQGRVITGR